MIDLLINEIEMDLDLFDRLGGGVNLLSCFSDQTERITRELLKAYRGGKKVFLYDVKVGVFAEHRAEIKEYLSQEETEKWLEENKVNITHAVLNFIYKSKSMPKNSISEAKEYLQSVGEFSKKTLEDKCLIVESNFLETMKISTLFNEAIAAENKKRPLNQLKDKIKSFFKK